ncbi:Flp pilus assembly protein TadG [Devosia enhydra]|uniref:Flp pilus assembly protein TadG n=1 Tax=Devosia enhydra TaxID=665118 RepID=A0A1K2HUP0_9HYPH|nr:TadE/TadG family type IV pilus assembly protein [Devosia enhydra]SFZ81864.1 Flp pilus assembly protein TadG [Devosia enhydra]
MAVVGEKRHFRTCARGASAVEFALILPVFLFLVMGSLAYGLYLAASHSLQQLAADAARASVAGLSDAERINLATGFIDRNAAVYPLLGLGAVGVEAGPSASEANQFLVTLTYDASALPIWNLGVPLPGPGKAIRHRATIRNGGA